MLGAKALGFWYVGVRTQLGSWIRYVGRRMRMIFSHVVGKHVFRLEHKMMYFIIIDTSTKLLVKYGRITSNICEVIIDIVSVVRKKYCFHRISDH